MDSGSGFETIDLKDLVAWRYLLNLNQLAEEFLKLHFLDFCGLLVTFFFYLLPKSAFKVLH